MVERLTGTQVEHEFEKAGNGFNKPVTEQYRKDVEMAANLVTLKVNNMRPWYERVENESADATSDTLVGDRIPQGKMLVLTHVSAKDITNNITRIKIEVMRGGEKLLLNEDAPSAAGVSINFAGQVLLIEGDQIKCTFTGTSSGDDIEFTASGYTIKA